MSGEPLISIIMPAHYSEPFIGRSVKTVLSQTYANWELVVVSDDSVDYQAVLAKQGIRDKRINYACTGQKSSGPSNARNVGLAAANGDYIALLDSDDLFHIEKLERCVAHIKDHGFVVTAYQEIEYGDMVTERKLRSNHGFSGSHALDEKNGTWFFASGIGNSFSAFDRKRIPYEWDKDIYVMEDLLFVLKAYNHLGHIYFIDEPLHFYVRREGSLTRNTKTIADFLKAKAMIMEMLENDKSGLKPAVSNELKRFLALSLDAEKEYREIMHGNDGFVADSDMIFYDVLIRTFKNAGVPVAPFMLPQIMK